MRMDDRIFAMKVTVFGAAFDPPHLGHQKIVMSLLDQKLTDSVWLLPVKEHAFGKKLAPEKDRLAMVELLAQEVRELLKDQRINCSDRLACFTASGDPAPQKVMENSQAVIQVETHELEQKGTSYTYQTLRELWQLYPEHVFSFVIGSDNLARFHEWQNYQQMLNEFPFFVYPRLGFELSPIRKGMILIENVEPIEVSSTQVRDLVTKGRWIDHLVPESIKKYILNNKLYL